MKEELVKANIEIEIPQDKWISVITREFPDINLKILSMFLISENTGNTLIRIQGESFQPFILKLKEHKSIMEYSEISHNPDAMLLNVKMKNPKMLISSIENELLLNFPISVQNGWAKWEIYGSRDKIHNFIQHLSLKEINIKLKSIGKHLEKNKLTHRQEEILNQAINEGYYEIPRKISLSELAVTLNISTSALSENLRRIYKKLLAEN
ncbi:MAG: hypothetical protein EAX96_07685 [Candidatus Lokiarchaeota archaeon]|nr:hypothetical protein [Candidatus Lokiarchaeota archaeon]